MECPKSLITPVMLTRYAPQGSPTGGGAAQTLTQVMRDPTNPKNKTIQIRFIIPPLKGDKSHHLDFLDFSVVSTGKSYWVPADLSISVRTGIKC